MLKYLNVIKKPEIENLLNKKELKNEEENRRMGGIDNSLLEVSGGFKS